MKKVLVTGAGGFLGKNTSLKFSQEGYEVFGMDASAWNEAASPKSYGITTWVQAPVTKQNIIDLGQKFDVIAHCAGSGSVGYSFEYPADDYAATVGSFLETLEYVRLHNSKAHIVYPSSAAVYGLKEDRPIFEDEVLSPYSPYGFHKKIVEELCGSYSEYFDIRISIIRFFSIYGNGLRKQLLWDACKKFLAGDKKLIFWGTGAETRDWIHVKDAANLMYATTNQKENLNIFNGGSGKRTHIKDILELTAKEFGMDQEVAFNGNIRPGDPRYYLADINRVSSVNNEPFIELSEGIRNYVSWFLAENAKNTMRDQTNDE